jgi:glutathione peroxidase
LRPGNPEHRYHRNKIDALTLSVVTCSKFMRVFDCSYPGAALLLALVAFVAFPVPAGAEPGTMTSAHDFEFVAIEGDPLPLAKFAGRPVLVVNTASQCGFTNQYAGLADIWAKYRDRGLVVLATPSNDFGGQEPGTEAEIKEFCEVNYGIDFPMTEKVRVKGADAHPFYKWAATRFGPLSKPRWNFHKYLISPDGELVKWFSTVTPPTAEKVTRAIEAQLADMPAR